jgi:hypothetical protein
MMIKHRRLRLLRAKVSAGGIGYSLAPKGLNKGGNFPMTRTASCAGAMTHPFLLFGAFFKWHRQCLLLKPRWLISSCLTFAFLTFLELLSQSSKIVLEIVPFFSHVGGSSKKALERIRGDGAIQPCFSEVVLRWGKFLLWRRISRFAI